MFEVTTKQCSKCKELKSIEEFSIRKNTRLQPHCKKCQCEYGKIHYEKNKITYLERNKRYEADIRIKIDNLKSVPCADCKLIFPPVCMDFDHISGEKIGNVSQLVFSNSLKKILAEIEKCEVVCACCHRIRTKNRNSV